MIITPNLSLNVWNLLTDPYDNSQLADNWARVDQHDHSPGKGVQIDGSTGIVDGSITQNKLASTIVTNHGIVNTQYLGTSTITTASATNSVVADLTTGSREWSGKSVMVQWNMRVWHSTLSAFIESTVMLDGTPVGYVGSAQAAVANNRMLISGVTMLTPSPGAHTIAIGWNSVSSAATASCSVRTMVVTEF